MVEEKDSCPGQLDFVFKDGMEEECCMEAISMAVRPHPWEMPTQYGQRSTTIRKLLKLHVGKLETSFYSPQAKIQADFQGDVNTKVVMPYILIISLPEDISFRVSAFCFIAMCKKKAHAFRLLNNNGSQKTLDA